MTAPVSDETSITHLLDALDAAAFSDGARDRSSGRADILRGTILAAFDRKERELTALRQSHAEQAREIQGLRGSNARKAIELSLVEQLLDGLSDDDTTPIDMEYWTPLHDKAQKAARDVARLTEKCAMGDALLPALIAAEAFINHLTSLVSKAGYEHSEFNSTESLEKACDGQYNGDWASIKAVLDDALAAFRGAK